MLAKGQNIIIIFPSLGDPGKMYFGKETRVCVLSKIRVNRGDWLGKPANFKEPNKRTCSDVQRTSHVTLTVHNKPRWLLTLVKCILRKLSFIKSRYKVRLYLSLSYAVKRFVMRCHFDFY